MTMQRPIRTETAHPDIPALHGTMMTGAAAKSLALLRFGTGFIFLWAFLDKMFGLHYSTGSAKSWLNGGSPTKGFMKGTDLGPMQSLYHSIGGTTIVNVLFMLGMLSIGVAVIAGIALRISAVAGTILMTGMWLGEFPLAQHTSAGAPSGSVNPIMDYHVIYALSLIVIALTYAGSTWGLGRTWARMPFVRDHNWAL